MGKDKEISEGAKEGSLISHRLVVLSLQGEGMFSQTASSDDGFGGHREHHERKRVAAMGTGEGVPQVGGAGGD